MKFMDLKLIKRGEDVTDLYVSLIFCGSANVDTPFRVAANEILEKAESSEDFIDLFISDIRTRNSYQSYCLQRDFGKRMFLNSISEFMGDEQFTTISELDNFGVLIGNSDGTILIPCGHGPEPINVAVVDYDRDVTILKTFIPFATINGKYKIYTHSNNCDESNIAKVIDGRYNIFYYDNNLIFLHITED